jgi:hypothetical protein
MAGTLVVAVAHIQRDGNDRRPFALAAAYTRENRGV